MSNFSFFNRVFKRLVQQTRKKQGLVWESVKRKLFTKQQNFSHIKIENISIGECNTILSAYTNYRHLG